MVAAAPVQASWARMVLKVVVKTAMPRSISKPLSSAKARSQSFCDWSFRSTPGC